MPFNDHITGYVKIMKDFRAILLCLPILSSDASSGMGHLGEFTAGESDGFSQPFCPLPVLVETG